MPDFLLCILQYVLIMIVILAIGLCGAFIGIKIRKGKNAKQAKNLPED